MADLMKIKKRIVLHIVVLAILVLIPCVLLAQDQDAPKPDGFLGGTGETEQTGIDELINDFEMLIHSGSSTAVPVCSSTYPSNHVDRAKCFDRERSDLFVILKPLGSNSDFPSAGETQALMEFFADITESNSSNGLEVTVHPLKLGTTSTASRLIADDQNAVAASEKGESWTSGDPLGESDIGTPNAAGKTSVYTRRIREYICDKCGYVTSGTSPYCAEGFFTDARRCGSSDGKQGHDLVKAYITYINQHEIGHSLNLYEGGVSEDYIMSPTVVAKKKRGLWTFYIPSKFNSGSMGNFALTP
jgi:hypothetical protein